MSPRAWFYGMSFSLVLWAAIILVTFGCKSLLEEDVDYIDEYCTECPENCPIASNGLRRGDLD